MIYELKEQPGYVISSHRCWLPGIYATKQVARYAYQFDGLTLQRLADEINRRGDLITLDDLRAAR